MKNRKYDRNKLKTVTLSTEMKYFENEQYF